MPINKTRHARASAFGKPYLSKFPARVDQPFVGDRSIYKPAADSVCVVDEHAGIVDALRARDLLRAMRFSHEHFRHVENRLALDNEPKESRTLMDIFSKPKRARN